MIRNMINTYIKENIENKEDVAILFSGGMDSLSILLSCLDCNVRPHLYSFRLDSHISNDSIFSNKISKIYNLDYTEIIIDTKNIETLLSDINLIMNRFNVHKKTQLQCIHPFLYVIPKISEKYVLSGLCADDLYGTSRSMAKHSNNVSTFQELRSLKHNDLNSSSYKQIKELIEGYNKIFIAPYKQCSDLTSYLLSLNYKQLNSPKQKNITYEDYKNEIVKNNLYRRNSNLQCDSKIREWHDELLYNDKININNNKSVVAIYNKMYKECKNNE